MNDPPQVTASDVGEVVADDRFAVGKAAGNVIRGSGIRVAGTVAGLLVGLISAPLVVRHLGNLDFGRYQTVISIIFVLTALTEGGLGNVAVRAFSTGLPQERRALIASLTGLRLVLGAVGVLGTIGFGLLVGYSHVVIAGIVLGAGGYIVASVQGAYSVALAGSLRLPALAAIDLLRSLTTAVMLIGLVLAGSGLTGFYCVAVIVQALALLLTALLVRGEVPLRPAFDRSRWWALLKETAVYAVAGTLGAVYFQIAMVSMSILDPGHQVGYYALAFRIVEVGNGIPWLLASSVLPMLAVATSDPARLRYISGRVFEGAVILGGCFAIAIVIGAGFGIQVLTGSEHSPAVGVLQIMGIGVTATFLVACWGFVLLALRMHRALLIANGGALLLAIALSLILIPEFHAKGGAATTAVLELCLAGSYVAILYRRGIRPSWRFLVRYLPALALGLVVGALLLAVHPVVGVLAGGLAYLLVLWRAHAIPSELVDALPLPWRR